MNTLRKSKCLAEILKYSQNISKLYIQLSRYRFGTGAVEERGVSPTLPLQLNAALVKHMALANLLSCVMPGHKSMIKGVNVSSTFWSEIAFFSYCRECNTNNLGLHGTFQPSLLQT